MTWPQLRVRLQITNGGGVFDSQGSGLFRGDGLDVPHIEATVNKTLDTNPNTMEATIYNLSDRTIDLITGTVRKQLEFTPEQRAELLAAGASATPFEVIYDNYGIASVVLSWGYQGTDPTSPFPPLSVGFIGGSTNMTRAPGLSSALVIKAEDGGQLLGSAQLAKSYKAGADTVDILKDLINACGLTVDRAKLASAMQAALFQRNFPVSKLTQGRGYNALTAPAADQIRSIMQGLNLRWSIQDGEFLLLDSNTVLAGYEPLLLDSTNGTLLGRPEQLEAQQLRVKMNANAEARPGRECFVTARQISAQYRIDRVTHNLDTKTGGTSVATLDAIQTVAGVF